MRARAIPGEGDGWPPPGSLRVRLTAPPSTRVESGIFRIRVLRQRTGREGNVIAGLGHGVENSLRPPQVRSGLNPAS
jgi:hypothetical protein